jgi:hypothetical protein
MAILAGAAQTSAGRHIRVIAINGNWIFLAMIFKVQLL